METQLKIFNNEVYPISLKEICSYSFEDFKTKGYSLNNEYYDIILSYYKKVYVNKNIIPFYHCLPTLNSITREKRFRFLIINYESDTVFVMYKVIQILKTKQIRVFDVPISMKGIDKNQCELISLLSKKNFVRFCFNSYLANRFYDGNYSEYEEYNNWFIDSVWYENIKNKKSWINKKGITILLKNYDFEVVIKNSIKKQEAINLRDNFNDYLKKRGCKLSKKDDIEFYNIVTNGHKERVKIIALYYKHELIAIRVLFLIPELKIAYSLYNFHLRKDSYDDIVLEKAMKHNVTQKMMFFVFNKIKNIDRLYILGYMPKEKRLKQHKSDISTGLLNYYIK